MASRNYLVGIDTNNINLEIKIGTAAGWSAKVFKQIGSPANPQFLVLAKSAVKNKKAIFPQTSLGLAKDLKGFQIIIEVWGDFRNVDDIDISTFQNDSQALRTFFFVDYIFTGGEFGEQDLDYDNDDYSFSTDGEIIRIDKYINFI